MTAFWERHGTDLYKPTHSHIPVLGAVPLQRSKVVTRVHALNILRCLGGIAGIEMLKAWTSCRKFVSKQSSIALITISPGSHTEI